MDVRVVYGARNFYGDVQFLFDVIVWFQLLLSDATCAVYHPNRSRLVVHATSVSAGPSTNGAVKALEKMTNPPWCDQLRQRLLRYGLPPVYVKRLMEELSDHLQDVMEEDMSTEANVYSRLGEPEQVAKAAVTAYRRRSFIGRHPTASFLVFAISPVVSLIILFLTSAALLGLIAFGLGITNKLLRSSNKTYWCEWAV